MRKYLIRCLSPCLNATHPFGPATSAQPAPLKKRIRLLNLENARRTRAPKTNLDAEPITLDPELDIKDPDTLNALLQEHSKESASEQETQKSQAVVPDR